MKSWMKDFVDRAVEGEQRVTPKPKAAEFPTCGGVYFIQTGPKETGPVKIGESRDINKRIQSIQTANNSPVRLLHYEVIEDEAARLAREAEIHQLFSAMRIRGEWFEFAIIERLGNPALFAPTTLK